MSITILEAQNLTRVYTIDGRPIAVVSEVSLSASAGEFIVIEGSSGSGKTTLLCLLSGLDRPTTGTVRLQDRDITQASEDDLAAIRNRSIGFVFQSFHLVPSLSAVENVRFPSELAKNPRTDEHALELMRRVGMESRLHNYPHQLSGGEKQRVALCRALINNPAIIFADEPTGNLDSKNGEEVLHLLLEMRRENHTTLLLVTHSKAIASMADRVITLRDGRVVS